MLSSHFYFLASVSPGAPPPGYSLGFNALGYVGSSLLGGLLFGYVLVFRAQHRIRRQRFGRAILLSIGLFLALYLTAVGASTLMVALTASTDASLWGAFRTAGTVLISPAVVVSMGIWVVVVGATQFALQVSDKFGQGILWSFLTGRYFNPSNETRIFMFLDVTSSTTLAERLGHSRYFEFIREFMADVTDPILEHRGEIYQYVGDEVVTSWVPTTPSANADCVRCFFGIQDHVRRLAVKYLREFDVTPEFRAALHVGDVTVGEIGIVRKDIIFSGDVLNTTSRLQGECRTRDEDLLVSGALLEAIVLDDDFIPERLGMIALRGREETVEVFAVRPLA